MEETIQIEATKTKISLFENEISDFEKHEKIIKPPKKTPAMIDGRKTETLFPFQIKTSHNKGTSIIIDKQHVTIPFMKTIDLILKFMLLFWNAWFSRKSPKKSQSFFI